MPASVQYYANKSNVKLSYVSVRHNSVMRICTDFFFKALRASQHCREKQVENSVAFWGWDLKGNL